jgi:phage/plasmid-like protein (TIGR03299 family)
LTLAIAPVIPGRRDALHEIGTDVSAASGTYAALEQAGLTGWNVATTDTFLADGTPVPGGRAAVATINGSRRVLGQVGRSYSPVQTEDFAALLDVLAAESGARPDVVTTINGGRRVLLAMKMPEALAVGGHDQIDVSMVAIINHLTGANHLSVVPFRVFCANQQPQITAEGDSLFALRHTAKAGQRLEDAGRMLEGVGARLANFQATAEAMLTTPMSEGEFLSRTAKLFPRSATDSKVGATRFDNRQAALRRLFVESPTQENIRWTAWGGYQAVVEYFDHEAVTRRTREDAPDATAAQRRAVRALAGTSTRDKLAALEVFSPDPRAVSTSAN